VRQKTRGRTAGRTKVGTRRLRAAALLTQTVKGLARLDAAGFAPARKQEHVNEALASLNFRNVGLPHPHGARQLNLGELGVHAQNFQ